MNTAMDKLRKAIDNAEDQRSLMEGSDERSSFN
jgi:hypothetical protein